MTSFERGRRTHTTRQSNVYVMNLCMEGQRRDGGLEGFNRPVSATRSITVRLAGRQTGTGAGRRKRKHKVNVTSMSDGIVIVSVRVSGDMSLHTM